MAFTHVKYKGKTITAIVKSNQAGWTWAFQINGGMARTRGDVAKSEAQAVQDAIAAGKAVIDRDDPVKAAA